MPCYHPIDAWRGEVSPATGRAKLIFKRPDGKFAAELQVPCGKCIGCRLEYSRQWAVRCMHEASSHEHNCFITLTYDDKHLPVGGTLVKSDLQLFQKRLNKWCRRYVGLAPRFFQCGEYGEESLRPHYHACLFGFDFYDKVRLKENERGEVLHTSELLTKLWDRGEHDQQLVGALSFESAAYVARYVLKKYSGDDSMNHYTRISEYGEAHVVEPEFVTMSRRPGIGRTWFERFGNEVYPSDEVIVRGHSCKPPRYYDNLQASASLSVFNGVRSDRAKRAEARASEGTPDRLAAREKVRLARVRTLARKL